MTDREDLRVVKTHMALYNTFTELLQAQTFDNITVTQLCDRALVRRATFYKHFADKYDFFNFYITRTHKNLAQKCIKEIENVTPYSYLMAMANSLLDFISENRRLGSHLFDDSLLSISLDIIGKQMSDKIYEILLPEAQVSPAAIEIFTAFYTGGWRNIIRWWLNQKNSVSKELLLAQLAKFLSPIIKENIIIKELQPGEQSL